MANKYWEGIGRRKEAVARVRIYKKQENSQNLINNKPVNKYFSTSDMKYILKPLYVTELMDDFYFTIKVSGGGFTGWKDAIRLGLARALVKYDESLKSVLRRNGLLTRDPRVVERKKVGLKKARKAPRFSKR